MPAPTEALTPAEARDRSRPLFLRLGALPQGSAERAAVRNRLVELNLWIVRHAVRRMPTRQELHEDVVQVGTIGLIKAINRFDPSLGTEFAAFALPTISGEIKRFYRDTTWAVHVPRRLQDRRLTLRAAAEAFEQTRGRPPTTQELARRTGLGESEIRDAQRAADGYDALSLDAPRPDDDGSDGYADRLGAEDPALARTDDLLSLKPLIAALPARDRRILALRFTHEMTQQQIGRELGVSQMQVSRLLSRTLTRLRAELLAGT
ncbi:SigB/SigF/SigG family RNA polymerase sigma factor [Streptomyces sp. NPDC001595]|uniref:SigB/SigF/SigG family RNA polymerase sigma factor n=1 Tax=Streptomyces sp. NPDC001532 TaxID=3154520 RepID=UPI0033289728